MTVLLALIVGILGLVVGSFLNVVIYRVPRRQSIVRPRSSCPACGVTIGERDNIPIVSWLLLRGRCRRCATPISKRYPLVEAATAGLFAAAAVRFGLSWELPSYLVLFASLLVLSAADIEHGVIPSRIVYPTLALTSILLILAAAATQQFGNLYTAAIGAAAAWALLSLLWLVYPKGLGFGDVRLAALLGAHLGFLGLVQVFLGIFLAAVLGLLVALSLQAGGHRRRRGPIPFAPFLAAGTVLTVLVGTLVLRWVGIAGMAASADFVTLLTPGLVQDPAKVLVTGPVAWWA